MVLKARKWTEVEDRRLLSLREAEKRVAVIAKELNRTEASVASRIAILTRFSWRSRVPKRHRSKQATTSLVKRRAASGGTGTSTATAFLTWAISCCPLLWPARSPLSRSHGKTGDCAWLTPGQKRPLVSPRRGGRPWSPRSEKGLLATYQRLTSDSLWPLHLMMMMFAVLPMVGRAVSHYAAAGNRSGAGCRGAVGIRNASGAPRHRLAETESVSVLFLLCKSKRTG
jgi:hypothetical protein